MVGGSGVKAGGKGGGREGVREAQRLGGGRCRTLGFGRAFAFSVPHKGSRVVAVGHFRVFSALVRKSPQRPILVRRVSAGRAPRGTRLSGAVANVYLWAGRRGRSAPRGRRGRCKLLPDPSFSLDLELMKTKVLHVAREAEVRAVERKS